jgi:hypothetical protein
MKVAPKQRHMLTAHGFSVVRGAGSKGEFFGDKVDLIATKQTRQNEFTAYLTIVGVQCKVRGSNSQWTDAFPHEHSESKRDESKGARLGRSG